jgi:hypothetical protein
MCICQCLPYRNSETSTYKKMLVDLHLLILSFSLIISQTLIQIGVYRLFSFLVEPVQDFSVSNPDNLAKILTIF